MEKHNLNVDIENDEQPISFEDEVQKVLIQSIREFLFNVVKHAGVDRAKIVISRKDSQVQIKVIDDGVGFDVNNLDLASSEGKRFGLFNIKERMELLGGALKIHSEPEKGTITELIAPLKEKEEIQASVTDGEQAEVLNTPPVRRDQNGKIKILLVDDHQIMREGIRKLIEAESDMTIVAEASDGKEAIELAKNTSPDVITMDINVPVMNGIEATKKIVSDNPHITVIGLSVHNNDDVKGSMRKAGASVFLSKSEAFELLCATIRSEAKNKTP